MKVPNLFIPGAAKSGTSSLHEYLSQHPSISMSKIKEPHFFCKDNNKIEKKEYLDLFDCNCSILGESSTGYMVFNGVIDKIKKENLNPKFIFILRNPVDRILSHYNWLYGLKAEKRSFMDAVKSDMFSLPQFGVKTHKEGYKSYFQWGLYGKWIKRYYLEFGKENILIICTEDLKHSPSDTLLKCVIFLGLETFDFDVSKKSNKSVNIRGKYIYNFINTFSLKKSPSLSKIYNLIPNSIQENLYHYRRKLVEVYKEKTSGKNLYTLTPEERNWLINSYKDDVSELKKITGKKYDKWIDFI